MGSRLLALPIDAVGHATIAISARRSSAGETGCSLTTDCPARPSRAKTDGAIWRQVSQSMHVSST